MVCGKYQSGKSTYLRTLTGNGAFYSGNGTESATFGILIDGPYSYHDIISRIKRTDFKESISDYQKYEKDETAIFFIDSQGLGDEKYKNKIYSAIFKRYLSFFCAMSDLCINISQMNDSYYIFDDVLNSIRQGQMFKQSKANFIDASEMPKENNNQNENENRESVNIFQKIKTQITEFMNRNTKNIENNETSDNDINIANNETNDNDISKILFLVRYKPEMLNRDPNEAKNMNSIEIFNSIQPPFQQVWLNMHQTVQNNYLQNCIKSLPLCDLGKSLEAYICSVYYTVPDIVSFLINSEEHTKDYFQDKIEIAIGYLFSDFFKQFFTILPNVKDQIRFITQASLKKIKICIEDYRKKIKSKDETLDSIKEYFQIVKNIIIPYTIGLDSYISIQDKNQYSYDLMKDLTSYTAQCLPELKENLYNGFKELFFNDLRNFLFGGVAPVTGVALSITGHLCKKAIIQLTKKFLPLVIPAAGEIITGISISLSIISVSSYFVFCIKKMISKKNKVEIIEKTNIKLSFPFLWERIENENKLITNITGISKTNKITSKVRSSEVIVVLENKESNFMKFVIQSMTGMITNYETEPNNKKEIVIYGPFKPNDILKRVSRYNDEKRKSFISKNICIVYLREYNTNDFELLERIKDQILFILSTKSINLYPKFDSLKLIYIFDFLDSKNIVYLRKDDYDNMQKVDVDEYDNHRYKTITLPMLMDNCNSFDNIGPIVNKCLRRAFHKILTIKNEDTKL